VKVVLFCGGKGVRLQQSGGSNLPKPLVHIGARPIIWHVMKYYAHYGHKDFILCLGYKASAFKKYFLNYDETLTNDFALSGDRSVQLFSQDIKDWRITFVDTGVNSNLGQRLRAVREHVKDEEMFLANYSDGLTDMNMNGLVDQFRRSNATGAFMCSRPQQSFHIVKFDGTDHVSAIEPFADTEIWVNSGYFVFRQGIFDVLNEGEELVHEPFARLIKAGKLMAHRHNGFWAPMDTFKDRIALEAMHTEGRAKWEVWK
jgi:glucose-1-phosphate cytidylyltransferase